MINYQTAKKNALFIDKKVNSCIEFDDAYYFYEDKGEGDTFEGFIIAKEDGRAADYFRWPTKEPGEGIAMVLDFETGKRLGPRCDKIL